MTDKPGYKEVMMSKKFGNEEIKVFFTTDALEDLETESEVSNCCLEWKGS